MEKGKIKLKRTRIEKSRLGVFYVDNIDVVFFRYIHN